MKQQFFYYQVLYNDKPNNPYIWPNTLFGQKIRLIISIVAIIIVEPAIYKGSSCYGGTDRNNTS
ncbi:hypothetical protein M431DRAFT_510242 [Trichoderma harzianum CBS 226.95]|uniref:Uncharacterized protein n=1 Tax=Trichoderma harzianum CBS 226.95 TaxID=983964 RepID=A0A2T4A4K6_TRIHA|nr:hypothetical protein M431DRAFT_510242 [Trichoderma harzianum CBS 226.95]PTB51999.1 hypothetical protein M431DRAFT_510242 [Trichoderma harzianum CBS 226.95]